MKRSLLIRLLLAPLRLAAFPFVAIIALLLLLVQEWDRAERLMEWVLPS